MGKIKNVPLEEIYNFVKENLVTANDRRMACGDGRYEAEQFQGAIRVFGADMGVIMAFAATLNDMEISLSPKEIVERYAKSKQALFGPEVVLDYHCDSHNHEEGKIGCGHIAKAADPENDGKYGSINSQDVRELFDAFTNHPASLLTILNGEHKEEGLFLVHARPDSSQSAYSINSKNKEGKSFFVVDADRIESYVGLISSSFSQGLVAPVNPSDVMRNYNLQMGETAKLLKADRLPWYRVIAGKEKGQFSVEQLPKSSYVSQ